MHAACKPMLQPPLLQASTRAGSTAPQAERVRGTAARTSRVCVGWLQASIRVLQDSGNAQCLALAARAIEALRRRSDLQQPDEGATADGSSVLKLRWVAHALRGAGHALQQAWHRRSACCGSVSRKLRLDMTRTWQVVCTKGRALCCCLLLLSAG